MDDAGRGAARRAQILAAAGLVFAERGYHRATIRDVARAAGVADGTIDLYFRSKRDLLLALAGRLGRVDERSGDFAAYVAADARAFTATYLRRRFAELREARQVFAAAFPELLADPTLRAAALAQAAPAYAAADAELARRAGSGDLGTADPQLLTRVLSATVLGLLVLDILGEPVVAARWDELPGFLTRLVFEGLQTEEE